MTKLTRTCDGCGISLGEGSERGTGWVQFSFLVATFPGYTDGKAIKSSDNVDVCSGACAKKVLDEVVCAFEKIVTDKLVDLASRGA
jgi:hypothetical protein